MTDVAAAGDVRRKPTRAQSLAEGSLLLLAEDQPIVRMALRQQLASAGFVADIARDGRQAYEKFQRIDYALVFTDLQMPRMDGLALARAIRQLERERGTDRTPIVALTALHAEDAPSCRAAGIDEVLGKPPEPAQLAATLRRCLPHVRWEPPPAAAIDEPRLRLLATDAAQQRAIVDDFLASLAEDCRGLAVALRREDAPGVARQAHRIKGASRMVGAPRLAAVADELERAATQSAWIRIREHAAALRAARRQFLREAGRR